MKVGIIFGGNSREREISFAGGRTVYDNLNKRLFEPVPIFVDSFGNFCLLNWENLYKGSIRDFYPAAADIDDKAMGLQIYAESFGKLSLASEKRLCESIGRPISAEDLKNKIHFAFLCLHGRNGEDGTIQGMLQQMGIPYSGSGVLPSAIGMDKAFQKRMMHQANMSRTRFMSIDRQQWIGGNRKNFYADALRDVQLPLVVRPANQGSSIGIGMLHEDSFEQFETIVNDAFFIQYLKKSDWVGKSNEDKRKWVQEVADIRSNIGLPLKVNGITVYAPADLLKRIESAFLAADDVIELQALDDEKTVLLEEFIDGREFSCIVVRNDADKVYALPPTEIRKGKEIFDYRSKYLAGLSSKVTPIDIPDADIERIRTACVELFDFFGFHVYARIDGFIKADGSIILNDPNTTSGMLPSSFFFHQAAEIGLNPSQFITMIIRNSLKERGVIENFPSALGYLNRLDGRIERYRDWDAEKKKVAVIMGGYSSERHISVESGRNIYEKLSASGKYQPIPIFLSGSSEAYQLHEIPISVLLKDNADDIAEKIANFKIPPILSSIRKETKAVTDTYVVADAVVEKPELIGFEALAEKVEFAFIALHGRPGEDGSLQKKLEEVGIAYNGSNPAASAVTIDKYLTNEILQQNGIKVARHRLVLKEEWFGETAAIEAEFPYPFVAKPCDDGCSSAVKIIRSEAELKAYAAQIFRTGEDLLEYEAGILKLMPKEEFPNKDLFLIEEYIQQGDAAIFLEITGGLLTSRNEEGELEYEVFEPSETLATKDILSLEEKFLAGEGQNITPARFAKQTSDNTLISAQVRSELQKVAELLNIEGYARIDAFVRIYEDGKVETIIIEINSLPGMTPATCIFHQAAINDYTPADFIDKIINYGIERNTVKTD